ncbi:alpha/beta fold hydrolase [Latilactobacillus graminis]|uniref:Alpha beta hydrolase n=2 Tax=Latilactobacillus graminis TaxID=60519 RepID=A0AA89I2C8_9LACO|nr:alpha/beta hydrolase [Latilactobacillus graminis]KRM24229.1 alpha beta hydrolase [Latilactobacillus graminis DSM 20719]QFP78790.1 alpha/beta hydrolase [Latilactobacillus graminis]
MQAYIEVPNQMITASNGVRYAYRTSGIQEAVPLVLLTHLSANLDNWDPRLIDALAKERYVITFDNQGVGLSSGRVPITIEQMARDVLPLLDALGYDKVDILSLSMGGMVAQELIKIAPQRVRKLILSGTGPRGGVGIRAVTRISNIDLVKSLVTFKDVKTYLFFTSSTASQQKARLFLEQIHLRKKNRDKNITIPAYVHQLKAIHTWGKQSSEALDFITQPTLVVNGDQDRMVPTENSYVLAKKIQDSDLIIYPDAGHASIFQEPTLFAKQALAFLA